MHLIYAIISSLLCLAGTTASYRIVDEPGWVCPLRKCPCPSKERASATSVGFALEIGYGTASIKYNNGTIKPIVQIPGSPAYVEYMRHLATSPIERMSDGRRLPPGVDEHDISTRKIFFWYLVKSWIRKLFLQPATPEIGILADMVSQLRCEVEKHLGHSIKAAAIASPDRVRLTRYEMKDIFDYMWMEDLVSDKMNPLFDQLFSLAAATAGYGDGLCVSYTDVFECEREEYRFPHYLTLQLDYSRQGLTGGMDRVGKVRRLWSDKDLVDFALGHGASSEDDERYWTNLEARIREFVGPKHVPQKLYLTGESASEPRFIEAVRNALGDKAWSHLVSDTVSEISSDMSAADHFLFATSMGAAEMAKRRLEGMARCTLPEECRGKRGTGLPGDSKEL